MSRVIDPHLNALVSDPAARSDPWPHVHHLQQQPPVYHPRLRAWLVTRQADVRAVLRDRRASSARSLSRTSLQQPEQRVGRAYSRMEELSMLFRDPPAHTRLRGLVNRAFTGPNVDRLAPRVEAIANALIDDLPLSGSAELYSSYALPLPLIVIAELFGFPADDVPVLMRWSEVLSRRFGVQPGRGSEARREADAATLEIAEYIRGAADDRRRHPGPDLLSSLVAVAADGDRLGEDELVANCTLVINAGHETTAKAILNSVYFVLSDPRLLEYVRAHGRSRTDEIVEELLRACTSVHVTHRIATTDMDLGGAQIRAGDRILVLLGAANRDPAAVQDPDEIEFDRSSNPHVSFGFGAHYCVGAAFARRELGVALNVLLERLPLIRLDDEVVQWSDNLTLWAPAALRVRWDTDPAVTD